MWFEVNSIALNLWSGMGGPVSRWVRHLPGCCIFHQRHSNLCLMCPIHHHRRSTHFHLNPPKSMFVNARESSMQMMMRIRMLTLLLNNLAPLRQATSLLEVQLRPPLSISECMKFSIDGGITSDSRSRIGGGGFPINKH